MKIGNIECYLIDSLMSLSDPVTPDGRFAKVKLEFLISSKKASEFQTWLRESTKGEFESTITNRSLADRHPR